MKFLCVECDEAMTLRETRGPENGSMSVIFGCPVCGRQTAMLTNSMETQVVRSLGVKIGGREVPAEPMEMLRESLHTAGAASTGQRADRGSTAPHAEPHPALDPHAMHHGASPPQSGPRESKCPFTGMVEEAFQQNDGAISWSDAARDRVERIPSFARHMAVKSVEDFAKQQGYSEITESVLDEVRGGFGI